MRALKHCKKQALSTPLPTPVTTLESSSFSSTRMCGATSTWACGVAELLKAGANPNTPLTLGLGMLGSETPLYDAARNGKAEMVAALLKAGANPNTPSTEFLGMLWSATPLSAAAQNGHTARRDKRTAAEGGCGLKVDENGGAWPHRSTMPSMLCSRGRELIV